MKLSHIRSLSKHWACQGGSINGVFLWFIGFFGYLSIGYLLLGYLFIYKYWLFIYYLIIYLFIGYLFLWLLILIGLGLGDYSSDMNSRHWELSCG